MILKSESYIHCNLKSLYQLLESRQHCEDFFQESVLITDNRRTPMDGNLKDQSKPSDLVSLQASEYPQITVLKSEEII